MVSRSLKIAVEAAQWAASDPSRWYALVGLCRWYRESRRGGRLRRGDLWVYAQEAGLSVTTCDEFRFDNNLWSALSRYVLMCFPECGDVIKPKRCALDDVELWRVWEDYAAPATMHHVARKTWEAVS